MTARLRPFRGRFQCRLLDIGGGSRATATKLTQETSLMTGLRARGQLTPSFFCRLDDDVVYWNTSRLSG